MNINIHQGINVNYKYYLFGRFRREKVVLSCHSIHHSQHQLNADIMFLTNLSIEMLDQFLMSIHCDLDHLHHQNYK